MPCPQYITTLMGASEKKKMTFLTDCSWISSSVSETDASKTCSQVKLLLCPTESFSRVCEEPPLNITDFMEKPLLIWYEQPALWLLQRLMEKTLHNISRQEAHKHQLSKVSLPLYWS
jgi:hypothetical protein